MDRLAYPNESRGREGQGRPLGLLMAWLMAGKACNRNEHGDLKKALEARAGFEERKYAREIFKVIPGTEPLFAQERACRDNEDEEPESF